MSDNEYSIDAEKLSEFTVSVFQAAGLEPNDAADAAAPLIWASLRGVDTHSVRILKSYYIDTLVDQSIKAKPEFRIEQETPISARVDGDGGLGIVAGCWGMRLAMQKARDSGVGFVSMRNSNHVAAVGYYPTMAIENDMIGIAMSGHLYADGNPTGMAPVFSMQPMFGTNPMSFASPCDKHAPYVLDMSTSVVPVNRVQLLKAAGQLIPDGWCLDANGKPTTNPDDAAVYLPLGSTRELGAHKGYGLAILVQILTAGLSASWSDQHKTDNEQSASKFSQDAIANFFGAIRIDLFREPAEFKRGMDAMVDSLHRATPAPGHDRVFVPGEIEHETAEQRRQDGIPLDVGIVEELRELSNRYNVPLDLEQD